MTIVHLGYWILMLAIYPQPSTEKTKMINRWLYFQITTICKGLLSILNNHKCLQITARWLKPGNANSLTFPCFWKRRLSVESCPNYMWIRQIWMSSWKMRMIICRINKEHLFGYYRRKTISLNRLDSLTIEGDSNLWKDLFRDLIGILKMRKKFQRKILFYAGSSLRR